MSYYLHITNININSDNTRSIKVSLEFGDLLELMNEKTMAIIKVSANLFQNIINNIPNYYKSKSEIRTCINDNLDDYEYIYRDLHRVYYGAKPYQKYMSGNPFVYYNKYNRSTVSILHHSCPIDKSSFLLE